jgi:hypothetical protein
MRNTGQAILDMLTQRGEIACQNYLLLLPLAS